MPLKIEFQKLFCIYSHGLIGVISYHYVIRMFDKEDSFTKQQSIKKIKDTNQQFNFNSPDFHISYYDTTKAF